MADQEQLAIIQHGQETWNRWRKENPELIRPNLHEADLTKAHLTGAILSGVNLFYTVFGDTNLTDALGLEVSIKQH